MRSKEVRCEEMRSKESVLQVDQASNMSGTEEITSNICGMDLSKVEVESEGMLNLANIDLEERLDKDEMRSQTANELEVLNSQQISKETELDELLNNHMSLVETKGTEMSELLSKLGETEDEKAALLKEVARIEAATRKLQDEKENLVPKIREKDEKLKKIQDKRNRLEKFLDVEFDKNKNANDQLVRELEKSRTKLII